tara:strand:- start:5184 stop:7163 length:1980 start_codon:yes stop_codon:yes gene_type:complete
MRANIVCILFLFFAGFGFSQEGSNEVILKDIDLKSNSLIVKIENLIIAQNLDSASFYISKQKKDLDSDYLNVLKRVSNNSASYSDYYEFGIRINNRNTNDLTNFRKFINIVSEPKSKDIELDYVYLKWLYISKLRNNSNIEEASKENNKLYEYVKKFNQKEINVVKANLLLSNHQIVLFLIENNINEGKALSLKSLKLATEINDNTLRIVFLNHLADFLIEERDLDGYIKNSELSLSLESNSNEKSPYYINTLEKLIDAYLYKGGKLERVNELLNIVYSNPESRVYTYSLYANFLRVLDDNSQFTTSIFKKFNVTNYTEFCQSIESLAKDKLDENQFYFILHQNSALLESKGFLKEAIAYKTKCVNLTRKIYSEDLSNSLANFKVAQAVKEKELEVTHEKEQRNLYAIIALLSVLVLISLVFVIIKKIKQEKVLKEKNVEISFQRDALKIKEKEKDLLLKEIHHRVKNNFQIVSSLFELQTKDIEDEKALELANEGKDRLKSMALIHQNLYQNEDNLVNFDEYIRLLVKELSVVYASNKNISTSVNSENMMFDIDTAIPLGLIINELITNAYKYAFTSTKNNTLNISINNQDDDFYKLVIFDNGPGLNKAIDLKMIKSLGLRLVTRLVKQLQGTISQTNSNGAYFEILFKDTKLRKQVD